MHWRLWLYPQKYVGGNVKPFSRSVEIIVFALPVIYSKQFFIDVFQELAWRLHTQPVYKETKEPSESKL